MKRFWSLLLLIIVFFAHRGQLKAQTDTLTIYQKTSFMIPMRDGTKLYTVVLSPTHAPAEQRLPILLVRTPYGASYNEKDGSLVNFSGFSYYGKLARKGYYFVFQDIRGKYRSEGHMEIHQPIIHLKQKDATDESTDTFDTIDWLIKHLKNNNGNAGILGISYPGWLALVGTIDHHPALKAAIEQACMGDLFLGDDFHHNGAFRLSYGMEYTYEVENSKEGKLFEFDRYDLFDWYRNLWSLKDVNTKYFHGKIPTWNHFVAHPNYDQFWKTNSPLSYVRQPEIPILHVGGYFDQEDINGPQLMFAQMEKLDTFHRNHLLLGPWFHGQWSRNIADSIGNIALESNTASYFQDLQVKWFEYYLRGQGEGKFSKVYAFQTGVNKWKLYNEWPYAKAQIQNLYLKADQKLSFEKPRQSKGALSYSSDPEHPIPYRKLPIEETYGTGSHWRPWQVEDQRFVYGRPDIIACQSDTLQQNLTITGVIKAHLFVSTTGSDADFIVKLIDVYPAFDPDNLAMSG